MLKKARFFIILMCATLVLSGCAAAVGGAIVGTGAGTYLYVNGELKSDYYYAFDKVWSATEKTIASMRGSKVTPSRGIGSGTIDAVISGEQVHFNVVYKDKDVVTVGIRVGVIGDEAASKLIHSNILDNLKK